MQLNVIQNAKRNIVFGAINKVILLICPFVERTFVQYILGAEYLGLGSLFNSILSVLSLTEMGFTSAVIYNMYKPTAEGNTEKVNALLFFYKRVYRIVGSLIFGIGICFIPFLPKLIHGSYPEDINLTGLYLIFLSNSVISYFLYIYMTSVLVANQRDDIQSFVNSFVRLLLMGTQVLMLVLFKNYYAYIILMPLFTIVNNLWIAWRVKKCFPQYNAFGILPEEEIKAIKKLVSGTFVQRICAVTRNSLDSICISAFLGLTLTAIYNNYYLILNGVSVFVGVIHSAFSGGVGNHVVTKSVDENFEELSNLSFVYLWISGWCAICLCSLYQPFMELWMGKDMMLPYSAVILLSVYFYFLKLCDIPAVYSAANGLWWEHRKRAIIETAINLILNIGLGKLCGVYGIIIATLISVFFCNYIWGTIITFKNYFLTSRYSVFLKENIIQTFVVFISCLFVILIGDHFTFSSPVCTLIFRMIICIFVPNTLMIVFYYKSSQFKYLTMRLLLFKA